MPILTKRWDEPREPGDGHRLLVCRYRPRGLKKQDETWDAWCKDLGPSVELHAAFWGKHGPPIAWDEYARRYRREMSGNQALVLALVERVRAGETITLLCSSACVDPRRCHRTILAKAIEDAAGNLRGRRAASSN